MKKILLSAALMIGSAQGFSAISASMTSLREYKELLSNPQLIKNLGAYRKIVSIKKGRVSFPGDINDGNFIVKTEHRNYETMKIEKCTMIGSVSYKPSENMGPKKMTVDVNEHMMCHHDDF